MNSSRSWQVPGPVVSNSIPVQRTAPPVPARSEESRARHAPVRPRPVRRRARRGRLLARLLRLVPALR